MFADTRRIPTSIIGRAPTAACARPESATDSAAGTDGGAVRLSRAPDMKRRWAGSVDRPATSLSRLPAPPAGLPRTGEDSDKPESLDRVTFLGQLGHRGIDPAAGEVIDVQSLDDLP